MKYNHFFKLFHTCERNCKFEVTVGLVSRNSTGWYGSAYRFDTESFKVGV